MKQYNGVPLDGRAMYIQIVSSTSAVSNKPSSKLRRIDQRSSKGGAKGRITKPKENGPIKASGRKGGNRRTRGNPNKKSTLSAEALNKELDSYLKAR